MSAARRYDLGHAGGTGGADRVLRPLTQEDLAHLCGALGVAAARALRIANAAESLWAETGHLHGLTKTAKPLLGLAAALRCAPSAGTPPLAGLTRSQRRILGIAGEAKDAVEAEIARRLGAIVGVADALTCSGTECATVAAALDDGEALELLVSGGGSVRRCVASATARLDAWNTVMPRPVRSVVVYAGSKPPTPLPPGASVADMARRVFRTQWESFASRLYGLSYGEDIEYVHELRVALRRLRAALRIFRRAVDGVAPVLRRELRRLADALGRVRDADVFLAFLGDYAAQAPAEHQGFLSGLARAERRKRSRHFRALVELLESPQFAAFQDRYAPILTGRADGLHALPGAGDERLARRAPRALLRHLRVVRKHGRRLPRATPEQQHALRIECKKLRYAAEFFADLYPRGLKDIIAPMVAMQDSLGEVHDADVYRERVIAYHARSRAAAGDSLAARALDSLVGFLARRRESALREALATWAAFDRSKAPRKALRDIA